MKKVLTLLVAAVLSIAFGSCVHSRRWFVKSSGGKPVLQKRASFDLFCPANQLRFVPLGHPSLPYEVVGVTGCGRRATYVRIRQIWLLDARTALVMQSREDEADKNEKADKDGEDDEKRH